MTETVGPPSPRGKKLRLVHGQLRGRPTLATWQLSRCGAADCVVCEHSAEAGLDWMPLEQVERVAERLGQLGTLVVRLSGGADPFMHPDLPGVVAALAGGHLPEVVSHGWMVTRERARRVWQAGLVSARVPLRSADPGRHDARVGLAGAHARAVAALRVLAEERAQSWQGVSVSMALDAEADVAEVEAMLKLAQPLGVRVELESCPTDGAGAPANGLGRGLIDLKRRAQRLESSLAYLARVDQALSGGVPGCQAGKLSFHIDYRGHVWRCADPQGARVEGGSLLEDGTRGALARIRELGALDGCRRCWRSERGEVESLRTWRGLGEAIAGWIWR